MLTEFLNFHLELTLLDAGWQIGYDTCLNIWIFAMSLDASLKI